MPINVLTTAEVPLRALVASSEAVGALGWDRSAFDSDAQRISVAAQLADAVAQLHEQGLTHGEVTLHSAVLAGDPPQVRLTTGPGPTWRRTPFFLPPEIADATVPGPDQHTDRYQLGLCVIRLLAKGSGAIQLRDPAAVAAALGPAGRDLLTRCLGRDRDQRPSAQELATFLHTRFGELTRPPQLLEVQLQRPIELPGADAIISWSQRYGTAVRIFGTNGFEVSGLDPDGHPHGYTIRPQRTGPIFVQVTNPYGSQTRQAGYIAFYEPPRFSLDEHLSGPLPRLAVPDLPSVPVTAAPLPRRPRVTTDEHPPPRLVMPSVAAAVEFARPPDGVGDTVREALRQVAQELTDSARLSLRAGLRAWQDQLATAVRERGEAGGRHGGQRHGEQRHGEQWQGAQREGSGA